MGSSQIRNKTPTRKTGRPSIERPTESNQLPELHIDPLKSARPERPHRKHKVCGAMAQQSGDSGWGNQSAPQKLLHLVGCREEQPSPRRQAPRSASQQFWSEIWDLKLRDQ